MEEVEEQKIERTKTRPPKVRTLIAFSSLIMLLFCVFVVYQASKAYETSIEDGRANADRLTTILADQIELTFLAVDLTLRRVVERHYFNLLFGNNLMQDIEHNLRLWVDETPQIASIMIVDEVGNIRIAAFKRGYQTRIRYTKTYGSHPVFLSLKNDESRSFAIAPQSEDKEDLILISRQMNKLDGSFGGVVIAAVDPSFFLEFFRSVDKGTHRFMSLVLQNGKKLFSGPLDKIDNSAMVLAHVHESASKNRKSLDVHSDTQTIKDTIKVFSYRFLKNLPIYVTVVIDEQDFLKGWRDARIKDISFLAIFTIFGSVLSFFALTMAKQIVRVEESESAAILASQAKSEFLANMSHELRTPLNAIIGFSEMINAGYFGELNEKQKERIHDINLCGSHLLQLISDILEFSKGEAGKLELIEENVDVPEIMDECMRIINEKARGKQITIKLDINSVLPHVLADKRKIRQVLLNLLSNSIKFTPEGGTITMTARQDRNGAMHLSVTDTGIGIPEAEIQKALSVFGQVHRNQSHEGTGLGLPLCKMFAELHGGKLGLTSKVGEGTTVTISLPAERVLNH
ncbi:MAG: sensor histidine kinase [Rickettsiales bacterium]|nr:sensor histidine kinase [Rickettsiales bacterium]